MEDDPKDNDYYRDSLLSSRYTFCEGGIRGRITAKYFEAAFAKSVVIAPRSVCQDGPYAGQSELESSGFEDMKNCILFNRNDSMESVAAKIKLADKRWEEIAQSGHDLVKAKHTTEARITKLLEVMKG